MGNYLLSSDKEFCVGCRACEQECPCNCISIIPDNEGFIYPSIDKTICINCNRCIIVCPIGKNTYTADLKSPLIFAAWNNNSEERMLSSSGGIFSVLAKYVLNQNGLVFGCELNEDNYARHISITNTTDLIKLYGSKYLQSDTLSTFLEARNALESGKYVLFSGTPCQIAGLKSFLNKDYPRLYLCDLICHGVPSPSLFNKYVVYLSQKHKSKILNIKFRDKSKYGWSHTFSYYFKSKNKLKKKIIYATFSSYYYAFLKNMIFRPSCYYCKYATLNREGDITLGDFWGVEKYFPELETDQGISLLLVNTIKGNKLLDSTSAKLTVLPTNIQSAINENKNLINASPFPKERKNIYNQIRFMAYPEIEKRFEYTYPFALKIRFLIPKKIKILYRKLLIRGLFAQYKFFKNARHRLLKG